MTTATPTSAASDAHPIAARAVAPRRGADAPAALVLGAVVTALGMALHLPRMAEDTRLTQAIAAESGQWLASHLLLGIGLTVTAAALLATVTTVRGRGATLIRVGAVLTATGAGLMALGDVSHGAVAFALADQVDPATSLEIQNAYFTQPAILGLNAGSLVITLGMIVLGAGLLRSRLVPVWGGIVVLVTPILIQAGMGMGLPPVLHGVPFVVGLTVYAAGRRRAEQPAVAAA